MSRLVLYIYIYIYINKINEVLIWSQPGMQSHVHLQSDSGNRLQYCVMHLISFFVHFPSFFMASSVYQRPETSDSLLSIFSLMILHLARKSA